MKMNRTTIVRVLIIITVLMFLFFVNANLFSPLKKKNDNDPNLGMKEVEEQDHFEQFSISLSDIEGINDGFLGEALRKRQSTRIFSDSPLKMDDLARLLQAAQGTGLDVHSSATRTAPSAGATHPIELFLAVGEVEGMESGVYQYMLSSGKLMLLSAEDIRNDLAQAALGQEMISNAPAVIIIAADFQRTTARYGTRGESFVFMESGAVAQNIALQAAVSDMGNVVVGAFFDEAVAEVMQIQEIPLLIIPVGYLIM